MELWLKTAIDVYLYRFPATDTCGVRFVGWSEAGETSVTIKEPGFSCIDFTLIPDRYGNTGDELLVSADANGYINIDLGTNPIMLVEGN